MRQSSAKSAFLVALFKSGFLMGVPGIFFANWPHAVTLSLPFGRNRSSTAIKVVSYPPVTLSQKVPAVGRHFSPTLRHPKSQHPFYCAEFIAKKK